jgi:hypothetical protein
MRCLLIDTVIQEKGLYVYNMHNIVKKHFALHPCEAGAGRKLFIKKEKHIIGPENSLDKL